MRAIVLAALFFATPAFAQDTGHLELAAKLFGGVADGAIIDYGTGGPSTVVRNGDAYEIRPEDAAIDTVATVTFAEPEPCVFTRTDIVPGEPVVTLRFDLNRARAVELLDSSGSFDTLNIITVQFSGAVVQRSEGDGALANATPLVSLATTLPLDALLAARDALTAACPGIAE